ncbi:acidic leucine-rich nuclear phosphoprotein 32 family member B [Puntigrus tetrazona]|uniref:acidic leucine-rich nuclear phosphoprotein 32 family member B n=1 Tax=Puntigrus tetrazona TaxID=1606681 RepID=UPI001C89B3EB|nr:acidic leucine-rich nuclear phosphoprotein 32 family member B [Puntigrus tetrazona]
MATDTSVKDNTPIVITLFFLWIILVLVLLYFYKKLNADTNGQYTVQRMLFAPGGLRDRLRQGVGVVENRLGVHIWPQQRDDEENIGGHDEEDEEGEEEDKQNDSYTEEGEQQEQDDDRNDSSDDYSSVDLRERAKMQAEKKEEKEERKETEAAGEEDKCQEVKDTEKVELLVDLKPFTGSAIWSEENKDGNDLTAL